jgi:hypothetical protein
MLGIDLPEPHLNTTSYVSGALYAADPLKCTCSHNLAVLEVAGYRNISVTEGLDFNTLMVVTDSFYTT